MRMANGTLRFATSNRFVDSFSLGMEGLCGAKVVLNSAPVVEKNFTYLYISCGMAVYTFRPIA